MKWTVLFANWMRLLAIGLCFLVFAIGIRLFALCIVPIITLFSRTAEIRVHKTRGLISWSCRVFRNFMQGVGVLECTVLNESVLRQEGPLLVLANHPTLIDALMLLSVMPHAVCVTKRELWRCWGYRGFLKAADYLSNQESHHLIDECINKLRTGTSLILFPEGTRSEAGELGKFHQSAAAIAVRSAVPLVPVTITFSPPGLLKGQKWFQMEAERFHMTIEVGTPWQVPYCEPMAENERRARRELTAELEDYFRKNLVRVGMLKNPANQDRV